MENSLLCKIFFNHFSQGRLLFLSDCFTGAFHDIDR